MEEKPTSLFCNLIRNIESDSSVLSPYRSCSRTPKPLTSALPGTMYAEETRSAVTDAVGPAPSLLPRLGAVAISVTTTALDRESGVVCGDACVYSRVRVWSLARESVGGVGFEVGL